MPLAMTDTQRRELDELGYTVLESFLSGPTLERVAAAVQADTEREFAAPTSWRTWEGKKADQEETVSPIALEMLDYEPVLRYVVDAMGWNIVMRDGLFACYPPAEAADAAGERMGWMDKPESRPPEDGDGAKLGVGWHMDQEAEFRGITHDGTNPNIELKASFFLSDHTEEGHAATVRNDAGSSLCFSFASDDACAPCSCSSLARTGGRPRSGGRGRTG